MRMKINVQVKNDFFSVFDLRNLRLSHTLVLSGHMIRKIDAGSSLGDYMFGKSDGRYLSGYMGEKGRDEKFWHPLC